MANSISTTDINKNVYASVINLSDVNQCIGLPQLRRRLEKVDNKKLRTETDEDLKYINRIDNEGSEKENRVRRILKTAKLGALDANGIALAEDLV